MDTEVIVGTLEVFGELKKNSLNEKIRNQHRNSMKHCPAQELIVSNNQNSQLAEIISQTFGTKQGRRVSRRSGRQLRYNVIILLKLCLELYLYSCIFLETHYLTSR